MSSDRRLLGTYTMLLTNSWVTCKELLEQGPEEIFWSWPRFHKERFTDLGSLGVSHWLIALLESGEVCATVL